MKDRLLIGISVFFLGGLCVRYSNKIQNSAVPFQVENTNPYLMPESDCLAREKICKNGTKINVRVSYKENYDFYVIGDDGEHLTLIMSENLKEPVAWISQEDYGDDENWSSSAYGWIVGNQDKSGKVDKGPRTILNALKERTDNWNNIDTIDYTLKDDAGMYDPIEIRFARARLLCYGEVVKLSNENIDYLFDNLDEENPAYWTSSAEVSIYNSIAYSISIKKENYAVYQELGLRPVIEVSKFKD